MPLYYSPTLVHTQPFDEGGPTNQANLVTLCRRHHRMKTHAAWTTNLAQDGTLTWTAPTGHTYTTQPATYPTLLSGAGGSG